uniref:Uncharacterized protein n=1 Tax=Anguilla anguilla TaxID=7936 RepID=A0A0E9W269_ANGAN
MAAVSCMIQKKFLKKTFQHTILDCFQKKKVLPILHRNEKEKGE